jgi:hypothetical protein
MLPIPRVLRVVPRPGTVFRELLDVRGDMLMPLLDPELDREDMLDRDGGALLRELDTELPLLPELLLLAELPLLPELFDDDPDDDLRLFLAADTGSISITTPSTISSINVRFGFDSFIIISRTEPISNEIE